MKIVVTDGYTLNPGDLDWNAIRALGDVDIFDRTPPELVVERCKDAAIVLTNKVKFDANTIHQLSQLQLISVLATGYNVIDIAAAREQKVTVCNVPGYGTYSVAQHVFALVLELVNHVGKNASTVAAGKWQQSADWCYSVSPITELAGKTFGIVGLGNIGRRVAHIAEAFGMKVKYYNPRTNQDAPGEAVALEAVFSVSDIVSLHCPVTADNERFVNKSLLQKMKPSAILINTARGQLIEETDLANALNTSVIAGAGLDVLSAEPPVHGNPLLLAKNCVITPHNAWMSKEARARVMEATVKNVAAFLQQQPINVIV